jgi:hypothetical protein
MAASVTLYIAFGLGNSLSMPTLGSLANHMIIMTIIIMWFE